MQDIEERISKAIDKEKQKPKNTDKLKHQQDYYKRLSKSGIAQKQAYNVKAISAI